MIGQEFTEMNLRIAVEQYADDVHVISEAVEAEARNIINARMNSGTRFVFIKDITPSGVIYEKIKQFYILEWKKRGFDVSMDADSFTLCMLNEVLNTALRAYYKI